MPLSLLPQNFCVYALFSHVRYRKILILLLIYGSKTARSMHMHGITRLLIFAASLFQPGAGKAQFKKPNFKIFRRVTSISVNAGIDIDIEGNTAELIIYS